MTTKFFRWLARTILLAVLFTCGPARAETRIAHTSEGFTSISSAAISDAGLVVFTGNRAGAPGLGVYKGAGAGFNVMIEGSVGTFFPNGQVAINDAGAVAIVGSLSGNTAVYLGSAPIVPSTLNNQLAFPLNIGGRISSPDVQLLNDGSIGFADWVFIPNGTPNLFGTTCGDCRGQGLTAGHQRLIVTRGPLGNGGVLQKVTVAFDPNLFTTRAVSTNQAGVIPPNITVSTAQMNDLGMVAYDGSKTDGTRGIYLASGLPVVESAPPGMSPSEFWSIGAFSLNHALLAKTASSAALGL